MADRELPPSAGSSARGPRWSNCLLWALGQIARGWRAGIGLWVEQSQFGWWPHVAVIRKEPPAEDCENYAPPRKRPLRWWEVPRAILFRGSIKTGIR